MPTACPHSSPAESSSYAKCHPAGLSPGQLQSLRLGRPVALPARPSHNDPTAGHGQNRRRQRQQLRAMCQRRRTRTRTWARRSSRASVTDLARLQHRPTATPSRMHRASRRSRGHLWGTRHRGPPVCARDRGCGVALLGSQGCRVGWDAEASGAGRAAAPRAGQGQSSRARAHDSPLTAAGGSLQAMSVKEAKIGSLPGTPPLPPLPQEPWPVQPLTFLERAAWRPPSLCPEGPVGVPGVLSVTTGQGLGFPP